MRFEIFVNGERQCVAGIEGFGVLSAIVTWVWRDPERFSEPESPHHTRDSWSKEECDLSVGGLKNETSFRWLSRTLTVGDEITVRVLPSGESDPPTFSRSIFEGACNTTQAE